MATNIKTVFNHPAKGHDIRRFQLVSLEKPFDQLLCFLTQIYTIPPEKLSLRYRDDDGDDCSLSSNLELLEAFRIAQQEGRSVLKVDISLEEDTENKEETTTPGNPEHVKKESMIEKKSEYSGSPAQLQTTLTPSQEVDVKKNPSELSSTQLEKKSLSAAHDGPVESLSAAAHDGPVELLASDAKIEKETFPSRPEFFSLLADLLHDSKSMEMVQVLLPGLLKLLDDDTRPPVEDILKNIFDFAPILKCSSFCARLLPFTKQLADPKMQPLVKDALHKLHDVSKLTSLFRSSKGSIPYMPDFVRLYNYMRKLSHRAVENEETSISEFKKITAIHRGVQCDECKMFPLQGNRYKCFTCYDYDLCEACEEASKHPIDHPMLKIRFPIVSCRSRSTRKQGGPRALFVEDVTLRDGVSCCPGIVTKTWALKNCGEARWPQGIKLLFLSGDLSPERVIDVPRAEPGEVVQVSAVIKLPMSPKQYTGYYRLATADGKKFGPRIWVDIIVISDCPRSIPDVSPVADIAPTPIQINIEPEGGPLPLDIPKLEDVGPESKEVILLEIKKAMPLTVSQSQSPETSKEIQPEIKEPMPLKEVYSPEIVKEPTALAPKKEVQDPVLEKEGKEILPKEREADAKSKSNSDTTAEPKSNSDPTAEPKAVSLSPYVSQLQILRNMGFPDAELNSYLLANNEGNVQRVVEWILSHAVH